MSSLPVIDLTGLADNSRLEPIATDIRAAMRQSGFMYVSNHGIDDALISRLRAKQVEFFDSADANKNAISINANNRGYLGQGMAKMHGAKRHDQKEVFFWGAELAEDHPDRVNQLPLCGPNQWPDEPEGFRTAVLDYADAIRSTGDQLLRAIARALSADSSLEDNFFEERYSSPMLRGQLIHYPPTMGSDDDFGVAPHTDFGCITLLLQQTPGLEVLGQDGNWMSAPPIEGTLVINFGDLLERWTDGRLPSTRHRVRNLTNNARYSIAMFHDPNPTAVVDASQMGSNTGQYEPILACEYIHGRNRGAFSHHGQISKNS